MIIEHHGAKPVIDTSATIAPSAIISGDVAIGPHTVVLAGAIITAEGAPVRSGERCVIMEHAVIRGAGIHPCTIADHVLIGPHSHVTGASIGRQCFIATGAAVFNGAALEEGTVVAIHAVVHISTRCPTSTLIPIGHIAFGDLARIYPPDQAPAFHRAVAAVGFTKTVFGFKAKTLVDPEAIKELCDRYSRSLSRHQEDRVVEE